MGPLGASRGGSLLKQGMGWSPRYMAYMRHVQPDLYHGNLVRAEVQPRFATYQAHLKKFIGGDQLSLISKVRIRPVKPVR